MSRMIAVVICSLGGALLFPVNAQDLENEMFTSMLEEDFPCR